MSLEIEGLGEAIAQALIAAVDQLLKDIDNNYEVWVIDEAVDCACTKWNGCIFEKDKGPEPIKDTHPNCRCRRVKPEAYNQLGPSIRSIINQAFG